MTTTWIGATMTLSFHEPDLAAPKPHSVSDVYVRELLDSCQLQHAAGCAAG